MAGDILLDVQHIQTILDQEEPLRGTDPLLKETGITISRRVTAKGVLNKSNTNRRFRQYWLEKIGLKRANRMVR